MIPVTQTKIVVRNSNNEIVQNGNCWASAIASILELPLSEVPNFEIWFQWEDGIWWYLTLLFLNKKGYHLEYNNHFRVFHFTEDEYYNWCEENKVEPGVYELIKESLKDQYYFISGLSPRGVSHVTIWQNGNMVHDPHPTREGILELKSFEHIRPLTKEEIDNVNDYKNNYHVAFPCHYKVNKN